jgi:hypothetical protein
VSEPHEHEPEPEVEPDAEAVGTTVSRPADKRPVGVTFVGVLALAVGAYDAIDGVVVLVNGGDGSKLSEGAFELALGLLAIAIARGVFRIRRWAWAALMTWAVIGLTHQLLRHFFYSDPNYAAMGLNTLVVLALTPLDVQIAFGVRPHRSVLLDRPAQNPVLGD